MDFKEIQPKWLEKWKEEKIFEPKAEPKKDKYFATFPFPYMNGGPHIGHAFSALRTDSIARFKRLQGFNVLFPFAFHATGEAVFGMVERLQNNEEKAIEIMKMSGATDEDIKKFRKDVRYLVKFWANKWQETMTQAGISVDWRRKFFTTKMTPTFSRFIEWQYKTLKEKDLVTQGSHPVIWCPHCKSPTGDHDRLKGEGESIQDYTIIKFMTNEGEILPIATLRPETVYGATNIWINPFSTYVKAFIEDDVWILSETAFEKIKEQKKDVRLLETIVGQLLIGLEATNPVTNETIPVFQADFVNPDHATGVVMSVPAHAPYDYIALDEVKRFSAIAKDIEIKSVIDTEEYKGIPAKEVINELNITSQTENEKLDKATDTLYKKEFHKGKMNENVPDFKGEEVQSAKEKITKKLHDDQIADTFYETTGEVICKCTTKNFVKVLENQWFLKYSDPEWKEEVKKSIEKATILPEESRQQFYNTVDWLNDKACARKSGLGTPLPWDPNWIVETLSDSTIYMAYYTFAHIIKNEEIEANALTDEVFDYIFFNRKIKSRLSGINKKTVEKMKKSFDYWYPVDMRNSGKDLIQNHLTFYLFHHTALFPQKNWPQAISVNGFVNVEGEKMAKSKGNFIPLDKLINEHGSDLVRINIVASAEGIQDADWRAENIPTYKNRIDFILNTLEEVKGPSKRKVEMPEAWLTSRLHSHIKATEEAYETMKFRSAAQVIMFDMTNDLKWYLKRTNPNGSVVKDYIKSMITMLSPLMPFTCEEIWEVLGEKGFVSTANWPKYDRKLINEDIEEAERMIRSVIGDIEEVKRITDIKKPKKITLFVTPSWKYTVARQVLKLKEDKNPSEIIKEVMEMKTLQKYGKAVPKLVQQKFKMPEDIHLLNPQKEFDALDSAKEFLENETGAEIELVMADESENPKANSADVLKPGILIE